MASPQQNLESDLVLTLHRTNDAVESILSK